MAIYRVENAHPALGTISSASACRFYVLRDENGDYAAAALAEHADCLELHLTALRFGPATVRALRADVEELKQWARALGKGRIVGLRCGQGSTADARWTKFTRLFGFANHRVYQAAELLLD